MEIQVASFFQIDYTNDGFHESVGMLPTQEQRQNRGSLAWNPVVLKSVITYQKFCRGIE
jgi:hypothetical protein